MEIYATYALHRNVLAVLVRDTSYRHYFCVIFPVEGIDHSKEKENWSKDGVRQDKVITEAIFRFACEDLAKDGYMPRYL